MELSDRKTFIYRTKQTVKVSEINIVQLFSIFLEVILRSQVRVSAGYPLVGWPGHYINVRRCGGLSMVQLELFVKRREFLPSLGVYLVAK